jgi:hypothetical protein
VRDIEEGIVLRRAGVRIPILVFGALGISDLDGVFEFDLTPTISTPPPRRTSRRGGRHDRVRPGQPGQTGSDRASDAAKLRCHLKIDTGMNRLGFRHDNLARTLPEIAESEHLAIDAVYTHFATARRARASGVRAAARAVREGPRHAAVARDHAEIPPCRQQRGAPARRARLVRLRPPGPPPLRHRPAAARGDCCRCDLPCHSIAVSCT